LALRGRCLLSHGLAVNMHAPSFFAGPWQQEQARNDRLRSQLKRVSKAHAPQQHRDRLALEVLHCAVHVRLLHQHDREGGSAVSFATNS
jgi:hypothetical protein